MKSGVAYHTVGGAAKMLRTNTMFVKKLMGEGSLDWLNLRDSGPIYITEASILAYQRKLLQEKREAHRVRSS